VEVTNVKEESDPTYHHLLSNHVFVNTIILCIPDREANPCLASLINNSDREFHQPSSSIRYLVKMIIKVILFDLGRTILYPLNPWPEILNRADSALVDTLMAAGISGGLAYTPGEFQARLNEYYDQRNIDYVELTAQYILKDFLKTKGYDNVPDKIIRKALDAMYFVTQLNWTVEDDALSSLTELSQSGYRLGLISNAADDLDVQQLIDRWNLRDHFEFIITSAKAGWRKPHPIIFEKAIEFFEVDPSQIVMVGDTLSADIAGAAKLGIYSIWITRRAQMPPDGELVIQPQAIISSLRELPSLLKEIQGDTL
jgi:HAD superfamily hydrolase (TIGR01662 family)